MRRSLDRNVTIIGAGVSGLTSAVLLQENGYAVRIQAGELPTETTSAIAAAIWHPFYQAKDERFHVWARESFKRFQRFATDPVSGVVMRAIREFFRHECARIWWSDIPDTYRDLPASDVPDGYQCGYFAQVPVIDTSKYLNFLFSLFRAHGGVLDKRWVPSLTQFDPDIIVVNATGLGARELTGDDSMFPVRGHVLVLPKQLAIRECRIDDSDSALPTYIIPRIDDCLIGGTAQSYQLSTVFGRSLEEDIWARCTKLYPDLQHCHSFERKVGFRPMRTPIRVERDPNLDNVIHNYGHGGSGFTVSWGCAQEVLGIMQRAT